MSRFHLLVGASALFVCSSCAQVIGIDDTDPSSLACVGTVVRPVGDGSAVTIPAQILNIEDGTPVVGMRVTRCLTRLQTNCDTASAVFSDSNGMVSVPVTSGFFGYLKIEDPNLNGVADPTDRVTYFWYFSEPIVSTRATPFPIFAMTRDFRASALYKPAMGITQSNAYGEIAINSTDCADQNATNVHFVMDPVGNVAGTTRPFYFSGQLLVIPSGPAQEFTDGSGIGGFIGVASGEVPVRAENASGDVLAEDTLLVRPDVLTTIRLLPQ